MFAGLNLSNSTSCTSCDAQNTDCIIFCQALCAPLCVIMIDLHLIHCRRMIECVPERWNPNWLQELQYVSQTKHYLGWCWCSIFPAHRKSTLAFYFQEWCEGAWRESKTMRKKETVTCNWVKRFLTSPPRRADTLYNFIPLWSPRERKHQVELNYCVCHVHVRSLIAFQVSLWHKLCTAHTHFHQSRL